MATEVRPAWVQSQVAAQGGSGVVADEDALNHVALEPDRTEGGTRRYSANDLDRLRRIGDLLEAGLNLAGVRDGHGFAGRKRSLRADSDPAASRRPLSNA